MNVDWIGASTQSNPIEFVNAPIVSTSYTTHPQAIYTSRLLDYKNLPEPQNSKEINIQFYSGNYFFETTLYLIYLFNSLFAFKY